MRNGGAGNVSGISNVLASSRMILRGNTVTGDDQAGSVGLVCDSGSDRARDFRAAGFPTAIYGCSDDGNIIKP